VSLRYHERVTFLISVENATTVTGSAITLQQATDVDGTDEKAQSFTEMHANIDTEAADALKPTVVASNTFTTDATNSKSLLYAIEIDKDDLDTANGFDCIRVALGNVVAATVTVIAILWPVTTSGVNPSVIVE